MRNTARVAVILPFLMVPVSAADLTGYLLARRSADGAITYEAVEEFSIGNRNKVRVWSGTGDSISENEYKRAQAVVPRQLTLLRKDAQGRLIQLSGTPPVRSFVLADGAKIKGSARIADLNAQMTLVAVKSRKAKQSFQIRPAEFFALIPGASPSSLAVGFVLRDSNFLSFEEQLQATQGAVNSFRGSPDIARLREFVTRKMADGLNAFEDGGPYKDFQIIVQYAELGRRSFADDKRAQTLHEDIVTRKAWLERTIARLTSLANNRDWDTLLEAYLAFEQFQWSFPEIMALRNRALQESARLHSQRGNEFATQKKYPEALAEYETAVQRDPDNELIAQNRERIMNDYAQSQKEAQSKAAKVLPEGSMELRLFRRYLEFASQYTKNKQFDEALRELDKAEELNKDAPEILLGKAELHYERGELSQAIPLLDDFDRLAVAPELKDLKERGEKLRNQILFERTAKKTAYKQKLAELLKSGGYSEAEQLALAALKLDQNDDEFNFYAGTVFALLRNNDGAKAALKKYLELSVSLRGDLKRRNLANRIMSTLGSSPVAPAKGQPNWFSGRKLGEDVFYCPESLAFQPRIAEVSGYKMTSSFTWTPEGRLVSITTRFQDDKGRQNFSAMESRGGHPGQSYSAGRSIFFTYHPSYPQVVKVSATTPPAAKPAGPFKVLLTRRDNSGLWLVDEDKSPLVLLESNPSVNPDLVALLDSPVATGVAGNSFFNPFVWDGIHFFRFSYDRQGRVDTAREVGADVVVRFTWEGERLTSLRAFRSGDPAKPVYSRTQNYSGPLLLSENVEYGGKSYKIEYKYAGSRLQEAEFNDSGAHDGRHWRVSFK